MKILVALSGGIDSSVMAHLLHQQGHQLVGVRFTLWTDPLASPLAQVLPSKCCNAQTAARSAQVAKDLNIPFHVYDLEQEFKTNVVDPFLQGYADGKTPNPCINCNKTIKFGRLLELVDEFDCDMLATGHYARVATEHTSDDEQRHILLQPLDAGKDQSYYLYGLGQEQLKKVLFPLGGLQKQQVFALAQEFGVMYDDATYRESQDLCFFPEKSPTEFLKRYLDDVMQPGAIVRADDGTVVGEHKGLPLYTIGQRRIGVGGLTIPLEVVKKDVPGNKLLVMPKGQQTINSVKLDAINFVSWQPDTIRTPFTCRLHSLGKKIEGELTFKNTKGEFYFNEPQPLQAEGQSLVLYRGDEVVGGGVMVD
jgi:tRNA-specific 2-thiouridylase